MAEFERSKASVGGRTIMVTSWFDETTGTWRASAPAYAHLGSILATAKEACTSRNAAVDRLSRVLAKYFETA